MSRLLLALFILLLALLPSTPASAHTYAATVYAGVTEPEPGVVRTTLDVEYVLLATDGARAMGDAEFEADAFADVQASGQDPARLTTGVLEKYTETVTGYVLPNWTISPAEDGAEACANTLAAPYEIVLIENVPHARIVIDSDCRGIVSEHAAAYRISTKLFPSTGPGGQTTTIVDYDLSSGAGIAELDTDTNPSVTTTQDWGSRMWEFFVLGGEHLLFGIDHILFLLALIVGSRRLRDILLAATAFTVAHSVTFILAAVGVVSVPAAIVEPVIALSIAVVALWHIWGVFRRRASGSARPAARMRLGSGAIGPGAIGSSAVAVLERVHVDTAVQLEDGVERNAGPLGFQRADWIRTAVVFLFGLIHGVGFAGALGIAEPFSWGLLGALLVFNVGIEAVQIGIIVVAFPLLAVLRRRIPVAGLWTGIAVAAIVAIVGLYWFVERLVAGG